MTRSVDTKLNVKPIFADFTHQYVYEGPCRFGQGESLTPEYDMMMNGEMSKGFFAQVQNEMPDFVNLMEPLRVKSYTDEFILFEDDMEAMLVPDETDVYIFTGGGRNCQQFLEFARRAKKPIIYSNEVLFALSTDVASLRSRGIEVYPGYDWDDVRTTLKALQVRKAVSEARALLVTRFMTDYSPVSSQDGFYSLEKVTQKLGFRYSMMSVHEFLDQLHVDATEDNPSTPGRKQQNITSEDMKEIERLTDELIAGADECDMKREDIIPSMRAYYLVQKLMKYRDCNCFSAPCPDMCSTRRLNQERCTLCMTHSLNEEHGIPSACEIDMNILICKIIMETLTNQSTYMGNSAWLRMKDGKPTAPDFAAATQEELDAIKDIPNLFVTLHSVANRQLKGYDTDLESYELRSFAFSGWGSTIRYDFSKDKGQDVTVIRIDPSCEKMLVIRGKIVGQFGFKRQNCSMACVYQVDDAKAVFDKTFDFGSLMCLTYGDHVDELKAVCDVLGLEMVLA